MHTVYKQALTKWILFLRSGDSIHCQKRQLRCFHQYTEQGMLIFVVKHKERCGKVIWPTFQVLFDIVYCDSSAWCQYYAVTIIKIFQQDQFKNNKNADLQRKCGVCLNNINYTPITPLPISSTYINAHLFKYIMYNQNPFTISCIMSIIYIKLFPSFWTLHVFISLL